MAETATTKPAAPVETAAEGTKPKRGRTAVERDPEGKQIGAYFDKDTAALVREAKFVLRLDKESDVVKYAVAQLIEREGISLTK